jgi:hypothetical protein
MSRKCGISSQTIAGFGRWVANEVQAEQEGARHWLRYTSILYLGDPDKAPERKEGGRSRLFAI